jgi:hypothetical protein
VDEHAASLSQMDPAGSDPELPRSGIFRAGPGSDNPFVSEKHAVECLRCGKFRTIERERSDRLVPGGCPRCGYLGWTLIADLTEPVRRTLREGPPRAPQSAPPRRLDLDSEA